MFFMLKETEVKQGVRTVTAAPSSKPTNSALGNPACEPGEIVRYKTNQKGTNFISYQLQYIEKHDNPTWMTLSDLKKNIIQHG